MHVLIVRKNPTDGRYSLCSNIMSFIGIKLDSTDNVIKNQKTPKEVSFTMGFEAP
jgi:hypothetical protein